MSSRTSATWQPPGPACSAWPSCWPRSTPGSPYYWPEWYSANGCAGYNELALGSPRSASCSSQHEPQPAIQQTHRKTGRDLGPRAHPQTGAGCSPRAPRRFTARRTRLRTGSSASCSLRRPTLAWTRYRLRQAGPLVTSADLPNSVLAASLGDDNRIEAIWLIGNPSNLAHLRAAETLPARVAARRSANPA